VYLTQFNVGRINVINNKCNVTPVIVTEVEEAECNVCGEWVERAGAINVSNVTAGHVTYAMLYASTPNSQVMPNNGVVWVNKM